MLQVVIVVVVFAALIIYAVQNWTVFRRRFVIFLPAGVIATALVSFLFASPDIWRNMLGGVYIALCASAFLTYLDIKNNSEEG